jgi:hypothetical protein
MFRPNCGAIFRLIVEELECAIDNIFNLRDLINFNERSSKLKALSIYKPPVQRAA